MIGDQPLDNSACRNDRLHVTVYNQMFETTTGLTGHELILTVARNLDTADIADFLATEYGVASAIKFDNDRSSQMAWINARSQLLKFDTSDQTNNGFRRVAEK